LADHGELDEGALLDVRGKSSGTLFIPDFPRFLVGEAFQYPHNVGYLRFASIVAFASEVEARRRENGLPQDASSI
jgi:hypothetical protein